MKFSGLKKSADGKMVDVHLDMTDEENQFFVSVGFNTLLSAGLIRLNEKTNVVELPNEVITKETPNEDIVS